MSWLPRPLFWCCDLLEPQDGFSGHQHVHDEICLVANDGSTIRHDDIERPTPAGTVFLFRRGERHGYRNGPHQEPHLWLVHYEADEDLYRICPRLADPDPERRIWHLDQEQLVAWQGVFARLMAESMRPDSEQRSAALSAWLRLLLLQTARWDEPEVAPEPTALTSDPAMMRLWEVINQHVAAPEPDFLAALSRQVPNYDSLRHRFKRIYGQTPRDLMLHLRIERSRRLLLETDQSITAIAASLGYARPAEFTRAFTQRTGQTPGAFRARPLSVPIRRVADPPALLDEPPP